MTSNRRQGRGCQIGTTLFEPENGSFRAMEGCAGVQEQLDALRERYHPLFNHSIFCIFAADLQGNLLDANDAALALLGYQRQEMSSLSFSSLIVDPPDRVRALEVIQQLVHNGSYAGQRIFKLRGKDGHLILVEAEVSLLYHQGTPVAVYGIARDITRQRRIEEVLRQSEERFRELAELLPEIVFEMDMLGVLTFVNRKASEISGFTQEDFEAGFYGTWLFATEDRDRIIRDMLLLMQGTETGVSEYTALRKDGTTYPVMVRTTPIFKEGRLTGLRGIIFDITQRKHMEEELRQHSERLQELVDERTAELTKANVLLRQQIEERNEAEREILLLNQKLKERVKLVEDRTEALRAANAQLQQEIAEREEAEKKIRLLNEQLEERVTERTRELEQAYEELKRLDGLKDTFLSLVSHELRTPLTSIGSFSEILLDYEEEDPATRREFLEIIHTETERLTRLINDVLDLSKIEAGRMVYRDKLIPVNEVIRDVVRIENPLLRKGSLCVHLDLWPEQLIIDADRDRIQQVVLNLLNNAIKFSPDGGEIRIRTEVFPGKRGGETAHWVRVSVADQGIGIDEHDLLLVFEKFSQTSADTLRGKPKGTGLGLPICKEIVKHYGGNIWVESQKGKGSTLHFTLPRSPAVLMVEHDPSAVLHAGKTILVVDENPEIRRLLRCELENKGCRVLEAADGLQAVREAQLTKIDLITLDLLTPMMNGSDALRTFREDPWTRDIPVLILSVVTDGGKGLLGGANDYLAKPFHEDELIRKVRGLLVPHDRSVLVVDDNPGVLETLRTQLEDRGYKVDVAQDGVEALERLEKSVPGCVVLDLMMPRMNGYELLNWIRSRDETRSLPVVILSSYSFSSAQTLSGTPCVEGYVKKSDNLSEIFEKVESLLNRSPE